MSGVYRTVFTKLLWTSNSCENNSRRYMSAAQAAAALRPFYFAVHPDLFGRYPDARKTNENSLKVFNGYLDELYSRPQERLVKSVELKFYLRARPAIDAHQLSAPFESVVITLKHNEPSTVIRQVLESCRLETVHLPPRTTSDDIFSYKKDENLKEFYMRKNKVGKDSIVDIKTSVEKLISKAENLCRTHDLFEIEIKKTIQHFKQIYGIEDVVWQSGWTLNHCKGCLQLVSRVINSYKIPVQNLSGWRIKFGRGIFVSVDGCLVLGVDDVPEDWCRLLLNVSPKETYFADLNRFETTLSRFLNDAAVGGLSDDPVVRYKSWLKSMIDKFRAFEISNPLGVRYFGGKFKNICIIIVNESSSLSWDDQGRMLIPSSTSAVNLIQFLNENNEMAQNRRVDYLNLCKEIEDAKSVCLDTLQLKDISWESFVPLSAVKECLKRLSCSSNLSMLKGHKVHLSRSYAVMPNGAISIPVNFKP